jgi:hypothetical protein
VQRVDNDDDRIVNHEGKANADQNEAEDVAHGGIHIIVEHQEKHAKQVDCDLINDVLLVDDWVVPLPLREHIGKHEEAADHHDKYAPDHDFIHEDDDQRVNDASHNEHKRVHDCDIPLVVLLQSIVQSLGIRRRLNRALKLKSTASFTMHRSCHLNFVFLFVEPVLSALIVLAEFLGEDGINYTLLSLIVRLLFRLVYRLIWSFCLSYKLLYNYLTSLEVANSGEALSFQGLLNRVTFNSMILISSLSLTWGVLFIYVDNNIGVLIDLWDLNHWVTLLSVQLKQFALSLRLIDCLNLIRLRVLRLLCSLFVGEKVCHFVQVKVDDSGAPRLDISYRVLF